MLKKTLLTIATFGLVGIQALAWAGDPAEKAEVCIDCHDVEEFEGMSVDEIVTLTAEANANSEKMAKATADLSADDLKAISAYLAAQANP